MTMLRFFGMLALCTAAGCDQTSSPSVSPAFVTYAAESFFETTRFFSARDQRYAFAAESEDLLISSDETGIFNVFRLGIQSGEREQLTFSDDAGAYAIGWFPSDDRFLYSQDGNGDELTHIFVKTSEGNSLDLTPGERVKAGFLGWSVTGDAFFLYTNERDATAFDVYRYATDDYQRRLIYKNEEGLELNDMSPDGRWVALTRNNSNADRDLFLVDLSLTERNLVNITPHEAPVNHSVFGFSPDSSALVYATDEFDEFVQAWSVKLDSGDRTLEYAAEWDVVSFGYSQSGRYRVVAINADARTELRVIDSLLGRELDLSLLPEGDISQIRFARDEASFSLGINSDTSPTDLFHVPMGGNPFRLTRALNPTIDQNHLVASEVVRFESFDGLQVPGLLYRPRQSDDGNAVPLLINVHGGPGGQSRKGYRAEIQYLLNHGYAVFSINNRGSSGYGKTFFHLDDKRHGESDLDDVVAAREFLGALGWVDTERIGIMGGSYGGYMVAAALAFRPDVFKVGINIFGVTNWLRTLNSIPPWWGSFRKALYDELGDPETDSDRLTRISPLFHAENIVSPMLVVQGANDPRVLQIESDELVEKVRANGTPVEYVLFEDEGHGFRKRQNRITAAEAYLKFLETYL